MKGYGRFGHQEVTSITPAMKNIPVIIHCLIKA